MRRTCAEKLVGAQAFTTQDSMDPILARLAGTNRAAKPSYREVLVRPQPQDRRVDRESSVKTGCGRLLQVADRICQGLEKISARVIDDGSF